MDKDNANNIDPFLEATITPPTDEEKLNKGTINKSLHKALQRQKLLEKNLSHNVLKNISKISTNYSKIERIYSTKHLDSSKELIKIMESPLKHLELRNDIVSNMEKMYSLKKLHSSHDIFNKINFDSPIKQYEDLLNTFNMKMPSLALENLISTNALTETLDLNKRIFNLSSNLKSYIVDIDSNFLTEKDKAELMEEINDIKLNISSSKVDLKFLFNILLSIILFALDSLPDKQLQEIDNKVSTIIENQVKNSEQVNNEIDKLVEAKDKKLEHISKQNQELIHISTQQLEVSVQKLEVLNLIYLHLTQPNHLD